MSDAKRFALPFRVEGYAHPVARGAAGVKDADGRWVAKCHPLNGTHSDLTASEAMATLIEAAPDLLAACEAALKVLPGLEVRSWPPGFELKKDALEKCRAALAKAGSK